MVAGEIPVTFVAENDRAVAINDIAPGAPTHVLVFPRSHRANVAELAAEPADLTAVMQLAAAVAEQTRVAATGWRLVFNTGAHAGQSVPHAHAHVVGGRQLSHNAG
jgi:histidine triad (HIT) family protein